MSEANGHRDLTLHDFINPKPRTIRKVYVESLGGYAYLRSLRVSEKETWEAARIDQRGANVKVNYENTRASLLAVVLCSADGRLLGFSDDDVKRLGEQDALAIELLYSVACEMNGLNKADVEELSRPNSATVPAVASGAA